MTMWIVALLVIAFALFFFEIFLPGGIFAIVGGLAIIGAAVLAFNEFGLVTAVFIFLGSGLAAFLLFFVEVKFLTLTPLGKQMKLKSRVEGSSLEPFDLSKTDAKTGTTVTPLSPSGRIRIGESLVDAKSEEGWIDEGIEVEIVGNDVFNVLVRPLDSVDGENP